MKFCYDNTKELHCKNTDNRNENSFNLTYHEQYLKRDIRTLHLVNRHLSSHSISSSSFRSLVIMLPRYLNLSTNFNFSSPAENAGKLLAMALCMCVRYKFSLSLSGNSCTDQARFGHTWIIIILSFHLSN